MGRLLYVWLVGLHPHSFRERFAQEMTGIYDEHTGTLRRAALFIRSARFQLFTANGRCVLAYREPVLAMPLAAKSSDIPGVFTPSTAPCRAAARL